MLYAIIEKNKIMEMKNKLANNGGKCWVRRQECPCGELKCYIQYKGGNGEEEEEENLVKNDERVEEDDEGAEVSSSSSTSQGPPFVGQTFYSDDDAFQYYANFAKNNGFAIRRESSKSSPRLGIYRRELVCYRAGVARHRKFATPERQKNRKSTLCGCQAKITIVKEFLGTVTQWTVKKFCNDHNHELLKDDQLRLLPAYRKIPEVDRQRILLLRRAGYSTSHIMKILGSEKGGDSEKLPFLDRDVRNFIQSSSKKIDRGQDATELLNLCKHMKERSVNFVYEYTLDGDGQLENLAWTYRHSVHAYEVFGDVVVFDVAFREITYDRLLGVWFGIDNHGKIIFFCAALLQNGTSHSFAWALQTFLLLMKGKSPHTILTDLDWRLRDAIVSEFPHTKHAFCMWHVFSKLSSWFHFPLGSRYEEFKCEFTRLYNSDTVKDFECQWNQMISRFGIGLNKHIVLLTAYRASWALPYVKGCFHAGMRGFECSKLIDEFLKEILSVQTHSENIFEKVGNICSFRSQGGEEDMEDVCMKTSTPMEEHASSILTPYAFSLLQQEITMSMQYAAFEMPDGLYLVRHHKQMDGGHLVSWTPRDERIQCSCKEFEFTGILCRHTLRVLGLKNYFHIPEKYLLIRWRQESSLLHKITQSDSGDWPLAFHSLTASLFSESMISEERINYVQTELTKVLKHVKNMQGSDGLLPLAPPIDVVEDETGVENAVISSECDSIGNTCQSDTYVSQRN
ncbi:hypothetical protein AQUCO_11000033v1 [Aquilegia coerulea]|uniref:Protein FAR1-RELATED SEQUENCE n=2 Tax=Aquilegia coerulea TaxID=218851 RepID=A0A2G5C2X0_AQUCA|nr:hypothetical protein AQUCO_11000033v1 [Aquilegia coerulea]